MPRILISVLAGWRRRAAGCDGAPARRLAPLRPLRSPRERRQQDEVDHHQQGVADKTGDAGGDPQVAVPEPRAARAPDVTALKLRRQAPKLLVAVVHVKDFVAQ